MYKTIKLTKFAKNQLRDAECGNKRPYSYEDIITFYSLNREQAELLLWLCGEAGVETCSVDGSHPVDSHDRLLFRYVMSVRVKKGD